MNSTNKILMTCLGFALISVGLAQEKKIYRWVDKKGGIHISDQLPPEANDQARKEYSANTGSLKSNVQPQLSAQAQQLARQQSEEKAYYLTQAEMAKRIERGLLTNYDTEQDLQKAFKERTDLMQQTIVSIKANIQSRRAIVLSSLQELNGQELNGQSLPTTKIDLLQKNHALILKQSDKLVKLNSAYIAMQQEFEQTLEKYRQFKANQTITAQDVSSSSKSTDTKQ